MRTKYKDRYKRKYQDMSAAGPDEISPGSDTVLSHFLYENEKVYMVDHTGKEHTARFRCERLDVSIDDKIVHFSPQEWAIYLNVQGNPWSLIYLKSNRGRINYLMHLPNSENVLQERT
jgi:hypothetical protein